MADNTAEQEITAYLESLTAPKKRGRRAVVDRDAVKALKDRIKATSDPIARLDLAKELRDASRPKAEEPAPHPGRDVFVAEGKAWADERGYTAEDLRRYAKVPVEVLRAAGFVVPHLHERKGSPVRAPRLDVEQDVLPVARSLGSEWRITELAAALERDVATTRNYVRKLQGSGLIEAVGVDAAGRGKPATTYRVR